MSVPGLHRVFVDSNVLYSRTQRDWLALLYLAGDLFQIYWSEDVLAETLYHLRREHPDWDGEKTAKVRDHIAGTFEVGRVDSYVIDGSFTGADQHDAHVHAAARACNADILLTNNVKHFKEDPTGAAYEVMSPDGFFCLVDDSHPHIVAEATSRQLTYWWQRDGECHLPDMLSRADCGNFGERVRIHQLSTQTDGFNRNWS